MKTTLDLKDDLLAEVKRRAATEGVSMKAFVEDALRARLLPRPRKTSRLRLRLPIVRGTKPPTVDIADRRALYDLMEGWN